MTANVEKREANYLRDAISTMKKPKSSKATVQGLDVVRVVLLKTLVVAIKGHCTDERCRDLGADALESQLTRLIGAVVKQFCAGWEDTESLGPLLQALSVVLDATDDLGQSASTDELHKELIGVIDPYLPRLREASEVLRLRGDVDVWSLRRFLAGKSAKSPLTLLDLGSFPAAKSEDGSHGPAGVQLSHKGEILKYVDAVVGDDDEVKLSYSRSLLLEQPEAPNRIAKLLAVQRMIDNLDGNAASLNKLADTQGESDLPTIHTILCRQLRHAETPVEFILIAEIIQTILDDRPHTMTQWNIELTLSTVSTLASQVTTHKVISTTPKTYECLCRLVQVIVRRYRLRLEGHFHILVTVLQSLLRSLVCHPYDASGKAWSTGLIRDPAAFPRWENRAKAFARLLTMVCEPTPGSVSRSQQNSLDSATDAAKRYAGQHMYLVLMLYIKLQLERNVPHGVREALEPGVFAILDITTPDGRRIMNDALDASGRAIMKELYKQYLKFGKWSGI